MVHDTYINTMMMMIIISHWTNISIYDAALCLFVCVCVCVATDLPYHAHSGPTDGYIYYLNVCGEVPIKECGEHQYVSSCQMKKSGDLKKVAGRYQNQTLRCVCARVRVCVS